MQHPIRRVLVTLLALLLLVPLSRFLGQELRVKRFNPPPVHGTVTMGWHSGFPYQYEKSSVGQRYQTGLDTELMRVAFERAGYRVQFVDRDWSTAIRQVEEGSLQALSMAGKTASRQAFAYYSVPYLRFEWAVFTRKGRVPGLNGSPLEVARRCKAEQLKVSFCKGHLLPPTVQEAIREAGIQDQLVLTDFEFESVRLLAEGKVDLVLADALTGRSIALREGWSDLLQVSPLDNAVHDSHIIFSKKSTTPEMVERVNAALNAIEQDGTRAAVVRNSHYPILLSLLTRTFWFEDIVVLAAGTAAVSGIFLAHRGGYNLVGAFIMAAAPAGGGGVVRDLVAGRRPVGMVADPAVLATVVWVVLLGFVGFRITSRFFPRLHRSFDDLDVSQHPVLVFLDALGMASFTVIGVLIALDNRCEPLWLWGPVLAAISNGGGSLIRDTLLQRNPRLVVSPTPYPEVAALWGLILSLYLIRTSGRSLEDSMGLEWALLATMVGVLLTRLAILRWDLRFPMFRAEPPEGKAANEQI